MSYRTLHERIEERHGHKFIRLKSGRLMSYFDARREAEAAQTALMRSVSRMFKLASDDEWDLDRVEHFIEAHESWLWAMKAEIKKRRGDESKRERIARLRNTAGRTPEEAALYRRKADELEAAL